MVTALIYFETERLIARDYLPDDYLPFIKLNTNPNVMKFFPNLLTPEESNALLDRNQQELALFGYGLFAIEEKTTGDFIGFTGFHEATFEADFTPCTEIGWRLKKVYGIKVMQQKPHSDAFNSRVNTLRLSIYLVLRLH